MLNKFNYTFIDKRSIKHLYFDTYYVINTYTSTSAYQIVIKYNNIFSTLKHHTKLLLKIFITLNNVFPIQYYITNQQLILLN